MDDVADTGALDDSGAAVATVGVFGGSGFYSFLHDTEELEVSTPWGAPSAPITIGSVPGSDGELRVAFLPRHGRNHELPPHRIPYRANVWAMRSLGVTRLFSPCASGSMRIDVHPGDLVVVDQLLDRTTGRDSTFFDGPLTHHISFADPYCPVLRAAGVAAAEAEGFGVHAHGTVVVVDGPRFSTRAESRAHLAAGADVINMTQAPEAALAREAGICMSALALITDYDTGVQGIEGREVTQEEVFATFEANLDRLRSTLLRALAATPVQRPADACTCGGLDGTPPPAPPPPT